jgi:hypothetical protein
MQHPMAPEMIMNDYSTEPVPIFSKYNEIPTVKPSLAKHVATLKSIKSLPKLSKSSSRGLVAERIVSKKKKLSPKKLGSSSARSMKKIGGLKKLSKKHL